MLEGHQADEASPYVEGDYGTREKLTRLVQLRCAEIIRLVTQYALPTSESELVIRAKHGVRKSGLFSRHIPSDAAMTIYEVSIPVEVLIKSEVTSMDEDSIMKLCNLRKNIIPELNFHWEFR